MMMVIHFHILPAAFFELSAGPLKILTSYDWASFLLYTLIGLPLLRDLIAWKPTLPDLTSEN